MTEINDLFVGDVVAAQSKIVAIDRMKKTITLQLENDTPVQIVTQQKKQDTYIVVEEDKLCCCTRCNEATFLVCNDISCESYPKGAFSVKGATATGALYCSRFRLATKEEIDKFNKRAN